MFKKLPCRKAAKHEADHGDVDHRLAGVREVLVVLAEPTLSPEPAERTFDHPATRQNLEPFEVFGALHDLQTDGVSLAERPDPVDELPRVSAVGPDEAKPLPSLAEATEEELGSIAILDISGMNNDGDQQPERIDEEVPLSAVDLLARIVAMGPPFSVVLTDWLSMIPALGSRFRPADWRRSP
jgi:hypothetical protein